MRGIAYDSSSEFKGIARELAEGVLEDCRFSSVLHGLKNNLGAELNKAALRLLAAVATADVGIARGLLRTIHFDDTGLIQCSRRRNTTDPQDVRSCFLNLVGSFVFKDSNILLRELIDKKNVFTLVFAESYIDKYANVMLNIQMFRKIVENRSISKTQKVRLFNRNCLKHLLYLYTWRGEAVTLSELNSKNPLDVNCDQLDSIRTSLHELMLLLFTSGRLGLVFSGRQRESNTPPNDLIFHALTSPAMEAAHVDVLRSQLVVASLTSCPDLIHLYLDHISPLLQPRASSKNWFSLMNLVHQIFVACKTRLVGWALATLERCTVVQQAASIIVNTCYLSAKMLEPIANALHYEEDLAVVKETKKLMKLLRTNVLIILTWISTGDGFTATTCTAEQLKRELHQLILERTPTTDCVKHIKQLFEKENFNREVLSDQCCMNQNAVTESSVVSDARTDADGTVKPVITRNPQQDRTELSSLPKELSKPLKRLLDFCKTPDTKCCPKLLSALNALPTIVEVCINSYFHLPVIHRCLANGLQAAQHHSMPCVKPKRILQLLVQHVDFTAVLLCNDGTSDEVSRDKDITTANDLSDANTQWPFLRDYMMELLLEVAIVSPKACLKKIPVLWFLASYTATLNPTDQRLLRILFLMDLSSGTLLTHSNGFSATPLVWGPVTRQHYQFQDLNTNAQTGSRTALLQPVTFHQPGLNSLFSMLDEDRLLRTATCFPINRKWLGYTAGADFQLFVTHDENDLFDPCFVLHALHHYLAHYKFMRAEPNPLNKASLDQFLRTFYVKHCLAFAVAALSSYSKHMRSMARTLLAEYRELAESWQPLRAAAAVNTSAGPANQTLLLFPERTQIMFILDTLRNSLASGGGSALGGGSRKHWMFSSKLDTGGRLTRLHANFFIRCLQQFDKPENPLYQTIWNCLLSKPAIDLNEVPDFLRTFFSASSQFRIERHWICRLCADSVADSADYLVLERSRVYKHVLTTYASASGDTTLQLLILKLIAATTRHQRLAHALIRFHALPLWLWKYALVPCPKSHIEQFRIILNNMLHALNSSEQDCPSLVLCRLLSDEFSKLHDSITPANSAIKPIDI
ncbi:hypothetical protein PHET_04740 [Paragonimus heterotremus]|uniref:Nucleolar pre-ribosomal-associated protein 1 C-terminal domain-containing protein n=1 Tax=Paragonimus heterotremus TaxID=100268 RepID=A0A8J4TFJ8_9TREM|nr:hypothetical protein PHET_04740 [Paragonimus heterotremus]